jgi:hypothetical protein
MSMATSRRVSGLAAALMALSVARSASAESHSVATVAPDPQLAHALDVALAPWGTNITQVHPVDAQEAMPLPVDRARAIALDTRADVVVWVSREDGHFAVWIYDVATDQASSRRVAGAPPFDPMTAAAVALSVKALLRSTVVAPTRERIPLAPEPVWQLGLGASALEYMPNQLAGRLGIHGSVWPAAFGHHWGLTCDVAAGMGTSVNNPGPTDVSFQAGFQEVAFGVGVANRVPLLRWLAFEPSVSAVLQLLRMRGVLSDGVPARTGTGAGAGVEPAVAGVATAFGGRLRFALWAGLALMPIGGVAYDVNHQQVPADRENVFIPEGGLRTEVAWP